MTPIEWNDSEPAGFPDFLPPKPEQVKLTREEAEERLEGVLAAAGIDIDLYATECGLVDVEVTFPDGATYHDDAGTSFNLMAEGYTRR